MYCQQCHHHVGNRPDGTPLLQCDWCYQFLIDDTRAVDESLPEPPLPASGRIGCTVCVAHWGDTFAALSHTKAVLDRLGQASCSALYYGPDPHIAEWIAAQPFISRVYAARPGANYSEFVTSIMNRMRPPSEWLYLLKADIPDGPDETELWAGGIPNYWHALQYRVPPLREATLPPARVAWAKHFFQNLGIPAGTNVVFLHPSSTWSAGAAQHWPHWEAAVRWLLENTGHTYLLTGLNNHPFGRHERLRDATGKLPTNMENLALVELCGQAITTCNSVSLWTAAKGIPALVLGNGAIHSHVNPFRRMMDRNPNTFLPVGASFEQFTSHFPGHAQGVRGFKS